MASPQISPMPQWAILDPLIPELVRHKVPDVAALKGGSRTVRALAHGRILALATANRCKTVQPRRRAKLGTGMGCKLNY